MMSDYNKPDLVVNNHLSRRTVADTYQAGFKRFADE